MNRLSAEYVKSILFGVEDSLVSTTGLVAGIAAGAQNQHTVLLAGIVAVAIEAVSMGAGEYLSDDAVHELQPAAAPNTSALISGLLMFGSYLIAGFLPLWPIVVFAFPNSVTVSVSVAFMGLFALGFIKGRLLKTSPFRGGLKILIVGGVATLVGVAVGLLFRLT